MSDRISRRRALSLLAGGAGSSFLSAAGSPSNDIESNIKEAISKHLSYSVGFRAKFKTGFYAYPDFRPSATDIARTYSDILNRLGTLDRRTDSLALIHYISTSGHLRGWLLDRHGVVAKQTSRIPYAGLDNLQRALRVNTRAASRRPILRSAADGPLAPATRQVSPADTSAALESASDLLLGADIRAALASRSGRLLVLAARDTGTAPFAALPIDAHQLVIDRYSVLIMPDIGTLADDRLTFEVDSIDWRTAFLAGDPDLSADRQYYYPPLPGARKELQDVATLIGLDSKRVLLGKAATLQHVINYTAPYASADIVYLASHAIADAVNPMDDSFVALTRGRLTGTLVRGTRFEAWEAKHPIVILSACQTGLGKTFDGGCYGIARAFRSAGAAQVVASLWNVDDQATYSLMTHFMDRFFIGFTAEEALASAQRELASSLSHDPAAWASFSIFGMPATRKNA